MRRLLAVLLPLALAVAPMAAGTALAGDEDTTDITLRVAPEGFVVPGHWAAGNQAHWIVDPTETTTFNDKDGIAGCELAVPDGGTGTVDGADVLDHATETGCISGWDAKGYDFGRFVTSVDGRDQVATPDPPVDQVGAIPAVWWLIQVDGYAASTGIDGLSLEDGQDLGFVYYAGV